MKSLLIGLLSIISSSIIAVPNLHLENLSFAESSFNDSLGQFVKDIDFGASLYVSNDSDIEIFLEKIKSKHKGKTVILDLWGTFCKPCLTDFKNSSAIKKELLTNDVVMVYLCAGISSKPEKWEEHIENLKLVGDHIYMDRTITRAYMAKFGFKRYPSYLVIDEEGNYKKNLFNTVSDIKVDRFLGQI